MLWWWLRIFALIGAVMAFGQRSRIAAAGPARAAHPGRAPAAWRGKAR